MTPATGPVSSRPRKEGLYDTEIIMSQHLHRKILRRKILACDAAQRTLNLLEEKKQLYCAEIQFIVGAGVVFTPHAPLVNGSRKDVTQIGASEVTDRILKGCADNGYGILHAIQSLECAAEWCSEQERRLNGEEILETAIERTLKKYVAAEDLASLET